MKIQELTFLWSDDDFDDYQSEYHPLQSFFSRSSVSYVFQHFDFDDKREIVQDAAVHAMCYYSFFTILSDWWQNGDFDITQNSGRGNDVLKISALVGCTEICKIIIERGTAVNFQVNGKPHINALMEACERGHTDIVKCLVQAGADVNLRVDGSPCDNFLIAAAKEGHTDIVKCLVGAGADMNLQSNTGDCGSAL
ncbi:hypothetical protein AnigIFM49718_004639 [Aspergillus niger]|nr:hypothetical protein AnigIFM49718_004639 [Aspergillus niger]